MYSSRAGIELIQYERVNSFPCHEKDGLVGYSPITNRFCPGGGLMSPSCPWDGWEEIVGVGATETVGVFMWEEIIGIDTRPGPPPHNC